MKRRTLIMGLIALMVAMAVSTASAATSIKPKTSVTIDGYVITNKGLYDGPGGVDMIGFTCKSVKAPKWASGHVYGYLERDVVRDSTYAIDDARYCPPAANFSFDGGAILTVSP